MPSGNTLEKQMKRTGGFASRLLHKQLEERNKKPSIEFVRPVNKDEPGNVAEGDKSPGSSD